MAATRDPLIGTRLGHCTIQQRIGAGGMGAVYRAHHVGLDKPVAIKVLANALLGSPDNIERFRREAKTAARLEHPNIVQVFDVGEFEGGHYLAMQYVEGNNLDRILEQRGRLPMPQALGVMRRVATALSVAHKAGVVHRDIKPANILISKDGAVKVADFGLARSTDSGQTVSSTGQIVGTPAYMAPEQARGEKVDARTDIYALGATMHHIVTGSRAFDGTTPLSVVLKQIEEEPKPAHEVEPSVPRTVSAVIARMMAKNPAERYQSADEVLAALDELKAGTTPAPPSRGRLPLVLAGAAGAILLGGVAFALFRPSPAPERGPQPVAAPPPPPKPETGLLRGVAPIADALSPSDRDLARAALARVEAFLKALDARDTDAVDALISQKILPALRQRFVRDAVGRGTADLQFATLKSAEVTAEGPRCAFTLEYTAKGPDGSLHTTAPQEMAWLRDNGEWFLVPPRWRQR